MCLKALFFVAPEHWSGSGDAFNFPIATEGIPHQNKTTDERGNVKRNQSV
jgi:hypothetical protein